MSHYRLKIFFALVALLLICSQASADTINVPADYTTIQAAIDAATTGDLIIVAAGTYREQLYIDGKSLILQGAGAGATVVEAPDPGDRTAVTVTKWTSDTEAIDAVVLVIGDAYVVIQDLTVDGRSTGPDNFYGVYYFDAGGVVEDCEITNVLNAGSPGSQKVGSLVATHGVTGATDISFRRNSVPEFQKVGILVMGPFAVFEIADNVVTNAPTPYNAGNGIQVSYGATGDLRRNVVSGVAYQGDDWTATGILLFECGDVTLLGDEVHDCQSGVNYSDWRWIHAMASPVNLTFADLVLTDNEWSLTAQLSGDDADLNLTVDGAVIVGSTGDAMDVFGTDLDPWGGAYYTGWDNGDLSVQISNVAVDGAALDGLWADDFSGNLTNTIHQFEVRRTSFNDCTNAAVNNVLTDQIDARWCYWGDPAGPTIGFRKGGTTVTRGLPSPAGFDLPAAARGIEREVNVDKASQTIYGNVLYTPWLPGNVIAVPDPLVLSATTTSGDIVCDYLGGGSGGVYGYSIDVVWDVSVAAATASNFTRPATGPFASAALFQTLDIAPGHVRVDAALGGAQPGIAAGPLFKGTFTAAGAEGSSTVVDYTILDVRDNLNQAVTGLVEDDGLIQVDTGPPTVTGVTLVNDTLAHTNDYVKNTDQVTLTATVTDGDPGFNASNITADLTGLGGGAAVNPTYLGTTATWVLPSVTCTPSNGTVTVTVTATDNSSNTATGSDTIISDNTPPAPLTGLVAEPRHNKIRLTWDDFSGSDLHVYGLEFRANGWLDYPQYATAAPVYPADHTQGTQAVQFPSGTTGEWTGIAPRDIYYLAGFVYDIVLLYGPADPSQGHQDRATSYWLGDVDPAPNGDGDVDVIDVSVLGATYGLNEGDTGYNPACDYGPTHNFDPWGIPVPDDAIQFYDLMICSLNFGVVSATLQDLAPGATPQLVWEHVEGATWTLVLREECPGLKGLNLAADLPEGVTCQVGSGELLGKQEHPVFLQNIPAHGLDAGLAILGQGIAIEGAGELCRVVFSRPLDAVDLVIEARDWNNGELLVDLSGATAADVPAVAYANQNYPNPFNPQTTIVFGLPQADNVRLAVYGVDGAQVRVLVDERRAAGRHEVVWDGRDRAGRVVATGTYFYVIDSGDFHQVRKMVLMK